MINNRSASVLPETTIEFLENESKRISSRFGIRHRRIKVVPLALNERDARFLGRLPVWSKLYLNLDRQEQSFGIAWQYAFFRDRPAQRWFGFLVGLPTWAAIWTAAFMISRPLILYPLIGFVCVGMWACIVYFPKKTMRRNFLRAVEWSGDPAAGGRYFLKRNATLRRADPADAIANPEKYANWSYRVCVSPENRTAI